MDSDYRMNPTITAIAITAPPTPISAISRDPCPLNLAAPNQKQRRAQDHEHERRRRPKRNRRFSRRLPIGQSLPLMPSIARHPSPTGLESVLDVTSEKTVRHQRRDTFSGRTVHRVPGLKLARFDPARLRIQLRRPPVAAFLRDRGSRTNTISRVPSDRSRWRTGLRFRIRWNWLGPSLLLMIIQHHARVAELGLGPPLRLCCDAPRHRRPKSLDNHFLLDHHSLRQNRLRWPRYRSLSFRPTSPLSHCLAGAELCLPPKSLPRLMSSLIIVSLGSAPAPFPHPAFGPKL